MVEAIKKMRGLITGSNGMLGSDIAEEFKEFELFAFDKDELDITKKTEIIKKINEIWPNIVINCAAYTDVDGSEANKGTALQINAYGAKNVAEACNKANAALIHFSSDYVFGGNSKNGYKEDASKNPISHYGYSKSLGEDLIIKSTKKYFIIRSSWLFGKNGENFVNAILKKSNEKEIKVADDQIGSPTYTKDLAKATKEFLGNEYSYGVYHVTNSGYCSWFEFAKEILRLSNSKAKVVPITSEELNRPAKRPKCSILLNTKFKNKLPFWGTALKGYLLDKKGSIK